MGFLIIALVTMIYSVFLIDGDSGILLLDHTLKRLDGFHSDNPEEQKSESQILANFFQAMNGMIDDIHKAMRKGRDLSQMTRILQSEGATVVLYYHYEGRVLLCSISDADDDTDKIVAVLHTLGKRFWQKHRVDVEKFRFDNQKDIINAFAIDIDNFTVSGKLAEQYPRLIVSENALQKVRDMGLITEQDQMVAKMCKDGGSSLQISKKLNLPRQRVTEIYKKLAKLDLIKF
jgi:hypothetical protein